MAGYGQFCPVAQAAEIVSERWTPLVLRELLSGSRRFNEIRRGVPLMSPSLLSQRLRALERADVVCRCRAAGGGAWEYRLTEAGEELGPLIDQLGVWGKRWARRQVERRDLDPGLLMWDIRRSIAVERLPAAQVVLFFELRGTGEKQRYWWLLCRRAADVDLCLKDPGFDVDLRVRCDLRVLTEVWVGDRDLWTEIRSGRIALEGPVRFRRQFPSWLRPSDLTRVARVR